MPKKPTRTQSKETGKKERAHSRKIPLIIADLMIRDKDKKKASYLGLQCEQRQSYEYTNSNETGPFCQ